MEASKFTLPLSLTFNDVLLLPGFSDFSREEINLETNITSKIKIKIPLVSSPMDTVTESKLAISLGKIGGLGVIHRNLSIENQAYQTKLVKKANIITAAAVGTGKGFEERTKALAQAGVDIILIDSAHGYTKYVLGSIKYIKTNYPKIQIIAGSIATKDAALALIKAGADSLRVGMGPGAICTTRIVSGVGVPQISALFETTKVASKYKIPVIADGGISTSGDMVKALAAGAQTVMMGGFFASTLESPGKKISLPSSEVPARFKSILTPSKKYLFKEYRGMGSEGAMKKGAKIKLEDEFHGKSYKDRVMVAEGVEGLVPIKGSVEDVVNVALGGIKSGFYYCGAKSISELHKKAVFSQITQASLQESHPHDILLVNAGKSYT